MFGFGNTSIGENKNIKLVLLIGNSPRHYHFANRLSEHFTILGIVTEASKAHALAQLNNVHPLVRLHVTNTFEKEDLYFGKDRIFRAAKNSTLIIPYGQLTTVALNFVSKLNPDYVVTFDVSSVPQTLLEAYPQKVLHLHNGLINYYNGEAANLWPAIDNRLECIGMTVHLIEDTRDGGRILGQIRPELAETDMLEDLELKSVIAGINLIEHCIVRYHRGNISPQDLAHAEITRTIEDLPADKILNAKQALKIQGLVQAFLSQKKQLLKETPIHEII